MYRYSSSTTKLPSESLVQTLSSKREKNPNKFHSLLMQTYMHVPGSYQDGHEYYIQVVNNLTELFDAR